MKRYLISPPVGAWCGTPNAERVLGSYTWDARPGRFGQILRTVRPVTGGWVNAIGLRNPGIRTVNIRADRIYSLAGIEPDDWHEMAAWLRLRLRAGKIELNLSCPNVHEYGITRREVEAFSHCEIIAKLPPTDAAWRLADICAEVGVGYLHFSNTIPSPTGGISGDALRRINLPMVERAAKRYPTIPIIAGGGIKHEQHALDYERAGARHFSVATGYLQWQLSRPGAATEAPMSSGERSAPPPARAADG